MRRRPLTRAAALLLGASLLLVSGPVGATSPEPSRRLSGKALPTSAQVAEIYPELAAGTRDVSHVPVVEAHSGPDCIVTRTIGRPRHGVWAEFHDAAGENHYADGAEVPMPFVYEFTTEQAAHRTMSRLGRYLERCAGSHRAGRARTDLTQQAGPSLGDESVSYSLAGRYFDSTIGLSKRREMHVLVRTGNVVVDGYVAAEHRMPSLENAVHLAQLTLASSSDGPR